MSAGAEPVGTIEVALRHAARLMDRDPVMAAEQASEILKIAPQHPAATLLLGVAQRRGGRTEAALSTLEPLARAQPNWAPAQYERALALIDAGQAEVGVASLRRTVALKPDMIEAWRALGDQLTSMGDVAGADSAYAQQIKASTRDPRLLAAAAALCENEIPQAEALLRAHLKQFPTDVAAIRMFAEVAARLRRFDDAEKLLTRCLELAPSFAAARHNYAVVLHRQNKCAKALQETESLLALEPHNPGYKNLKAAILARIGDFEQSIDLYATVLAAHPLPAENLDELRARAENPRARERQHRRLRKKSHAAAEPRRGVLESRESEDRALHARADRVDAHTTRARRPCG